MIKQDDNFDERLAEYQFDIRRWKSQLNHFEKEIIFINRLLGSDIMQSATTYTMRERLLLFRKKIKAKSDLLLDFKLEIENQPALLNEMIAAGTAITATDYAEKHSFTKDRFERFSKEFNELRTKVLLQTGNVL